MKYYLASWCCEGLETLMDISEYEDKAWEKKNLVNLLAEKEQESNPINKILHFMVMRARVNSHRFYEIYAFKSDIDKEDIEEAFLADNPQIIVNLIRKIGFKIYCNRAQPNKFKIL